MKKLDYFRRSKPRHHRFKKTRGSVLPLVVICIVGLCGIGAISVDVGMMFFARQRAQNVADAGAIAGAALLPATTSAQQANVTAVVNSVITASNVNNLRMFHTTVSYPTTVTKDDGTTVTVPAGYAIKVDGYVDAPMTFSPVVGFRPLSVDGTTPNTKSVPAHGTCATLGPPQTLPAGTGVVPVSIIGDDPNSSYSDIAYVSNLLTNSPHPNTPTPGVYQTADKIFTVKDGSPGNNGNSNGNFGALAIGGNGASVYRAGLGHPSTVTLNVGDVVDTKPGNMVGPTQQGVTERIDSSNTDFTHHYTSYTDWFFGDPNMPIDSSIPAVTDPSTGVTYYYHIDPNRQTKTDAHIMIVPIITTPGKGGRSTVTILGFGVFFLESTNPGNGQNSVISGRFIGLAIPGTDPSTSPGGGALSAVKLI